MSNVTIDLARTGERLISDYKNRTAVEHLHRYSIAKDYVSEKVVLDIASGEGYGSNLLSQTAKFVYGVDIAQEAVSHAQVKYQKSNLSFLVGSAAKIPLEDHSVDVIVSFETIEHHDQHTEMMLECTRVLKNGGILIISSPDKKYYSDIPQYVNKYHVKELYKDEFYRLVKSHFPFVHLYKQGIVIGSIIYNEDEIKTKLRLYRGDYDATSVNNDIINPNYNLIIASHIPFESHPDSYFESEFVNADIENELKQYKSLYDSIKESKTYKAARLISMPFRAVKKIVNVFYK